MSAHNENTRIEAFSDGVFAIAITLLILEIKVPPVESVHSSAELWCALTHLWPSFFAFGLSFMMILINWVNHHSALKCIDKSSPQFMYVSGFYLLTVVVLPFPTALMAEYLQTPFAQPAVVFFMFISTIANIAWIVLFASMQKPVMLAKDSQAEQVLKNGLRLSLYGLPIYASLTVLAWWFPLTVLILNTILWFGWLIIGLTYHKVERKES